MTALTATGIITAGYRDAQKLARGATLSADQLTEGMDRLNDLINLWQTQGLKLFLETEIPIPLVALQQTYTLMPGGSVNMTKPLQVKQGIYIDSGGAARDLYLLSRDEWTRLSNRSQTGAVSQFFPEKKHDRLSVHLWHVPDASAATGSVKVVVRSQASNVAAAGDNILFPPEWALALRWGIADEVSIGMPDAVQQRCSARAQAYRAALEDWDVEEAETYFQPDARLYSGSRFR